MNWQGVIPAITTPFNADLSIDTAFLGEHCHWLIDNGCAGVVALGSLGEGGTLTNQEKARVLETCVKAVGNRGSVVAGISSLTTRDGVELAQTAASIGCDALMVLPPYVYVGDWREMKAHVSAIFEATSLSCMLYNNPIAYKTDFLPEHIQELAGEYPNLHAVKESSADVRRITAIKALTGDRLAIFCGVDDLIVEAVYAGAVGWIAGLANALPKESVQVFNDAAAGNHAAASELYNWFLPLLRMDTVPKFVQLIKQVQQELNRGSNRVRPPRLTLPGRELEETKAIVAQALSTHPRRQAASLSQT